MPDGAGGLPFVGDKLHTACAVTNRENLVEVAGVEVIAGGHPLPDEASVRGADAIESAARSARPGDLLLVLISGGGSALICAPMPEIALADKISLNQALIRSGADITEINAVRQSFSRLKGGRLAQLASGARVLSLILSDVPGDDVATIASGPTAKPSTRAADATAILERYDLVGTLSPTLCAYLDGSAAMTQPHDECFDHVENVVIGSNAISLQRVMSSAGSHYPVVVKADDWLDGDVSEAAATLHRLAAPTAETARQMRRAASSMPARQAGCGNWAAVRKTT